MHKGEVTPLALCWRGYICISFCSRSSMSTCHNIWIKYFLLILSWNHRYWKKKKSRIIQVYL